jgi:hypothetical protein
MQYQNSMYTLTIHSKFFKAYLNRKMALKHTDNEALMPSRLPSYFLKNYIINSQPENVEIYSSLCVGVVVVRVLDQLGLTLTALVVPVSERCFAAGTNEPK